MDIDQETNSVDWEKHTTLNRDSLSLASKKEPFINLEGYDSKSFVGTTNKEPLESEYVEILWMIKNAIPTRSLEKAIQMLNESQIKKKPNEKVFCDYIPPMSHIPEAYKDYRYRPQQRREITVNHPKDKLLPKVFNTEKDEIQYKQKREIAKSFVAKGYGSQIAQSFLNKAGFRCVVSKESYKQIMSIIIPQTFRKLQSFLIDQCQLKIKPITKAQMSNTVSYIIRSNPNSEYLYVFKKFMRYSFALSAVQISEIETVHFYLQVMKALYNKRLTIEGVQKYYSTPGLDQKPESSNNSDGSVEIQDIRQSKFFRNSLKRESLNEAYEQIIDYDIVKTFIKCKDIKITTKTLAGIYPTWTSFEKITGKIRIIQYQLN